MSTKPILHLSFEFSSKLLEDAGITLVDGPVKAEIHMMGGDTGHGTINGERCLAYLEPGQFEEDLNLEAAVGRVGVKQAKLTVVVDPRNNTAWLQNGNRYTDSVDGKEIKPDVRPVDTEFARLTGEKSKLSVEELAELATRLRDHVREQRASEEQAAA